MSKQKTSKTVLKRFKFTKKGKILRGRQNAGHLRANKSKRQKRKFKEPKKLNNKQVKMVRSLLFR